MPRGSLCTLAGLAATFLEPDQGRVLVDGVDLQQVKLASYRAQLELVLQNDFLFDGTIRQDLLFAREGRYHQLYTLQARI